MLSLNHCVDIENDDNQTPSAFHKPIHSSPAPAMIMQTKTPPIQMFDPIRPIPTNSNSNAYIPNLPMPTTYNNYSSVWYENTSGNGLTYATNDSMPYTRAYHRQRQYENRDHPYAPIQCTSTMLASADDEIQAYSNFGYLREIYPRNGLTNYTDVANSHNNRALKQAGSNCSEISAPINFPSIIRNENINTLSSSGTSSFSPKQVSGGYFSHQSNNMRITSVAAHYSPVHPTTLVSVSPILHTQQDNGQNNQSGNETKENTTNAITTKKKRGRKPKAECDNTRNEMVVSIPGGTALFTVALAPIKKKRGRPPKPKPAMFVIESAKPVATKRYENRSVATLESYKRFPELTTNLTSTARQLDDQVQGPSSKHVADESNLIRLDDIPKSKFQKLTLEADKSKDEDINVVNQGVTTSSPHTKTCKTHGQTQYNTIVPINESLMETNEPPNECEPSRNAPPETRDPENYDLNALTNEQGETLTTTQAIILPSATTTPNRNGKDYTNQKDNDHTKGQQNSNTDKPNKLKRRKKANKKQVTASSSKCIIDEKLEFIDDQAVATTSKPILKDTSGTTSNVGKPSLDMPNIFDMLESLPSPSPPPNQADNDDRRSESLTDLEEMINVHIYGNAEKKSQKLEASKITKHNEQQCTPPKKPTEVAVSYSPCFLSDLSDDESNDVEMHANRDSIKESTLNTNPKLPSSSNQTRSSLPQNVINKTLPISAPINYFHHLPEQNNSMDIDVENSNTNSVTSLSGFSPQSWYSNQQNPNVFDIDTRQSNLPALHDTDHRNSRQDLDLAAVERSVGRVFGEFNLKEDDIVETAIPQTNNFNTDAFLQYRDPAFAQVRNKQPIKNNKTHFTSFWQEIIKFNQEEAKIQVCPKLASNGEHLPLFNANFTRKYTIKPDECESAFVKVCKLPSTEKSDEGKESNKSSEILGYEEGEIFEYEDEPILPTDLEPVSHFSNSFISGPALVHGYDSFHRPAYSQPDPATFNTPDWHQEVSPEILPLPFVDHGHVIRDNSTGGNCTLTGHSKLYQGNNLTRIDFIHGNGLGANNSLHAAATRSSCNSNRKNHQNNDVSKSLVTRKIENVAHSSIGSKRKAAVHTINPKSQSLVPENIKMSNKSVRTHTMIKKLIKFTNSQTCTSSVNETRSKLNADLDKVFLLGSSKPKLSPCSKKESQLKEVMLEIPGPMERRARNNEPVSKNIAKSDSAAEKYSRLRELAKKKIADQINTKINRKDNMIKKVLSNKAQITTTKIGKLSTCCNSSKSEKQTGVEQNESTSGQSAGENEEIANTAGVQTQQNKNTGLYEENISSTEMVNETSKTVNNTEDQIQHNGDIDFDEDDYDILKIHAERDIMLDF